MDVECMNWCGQANGLTSSNNELNHYCSVACKGGLKMIEMDKTFCSSCSIHQACLQEAISKFEF